MWTIGIACAVAALELVFLGSPGWAALPIACLALATFTGR
jgi:hypothetical protein